MKLDMAMLCDAVSIREGLLHILGGGITRIWAEQFPTAINATLAMRMLIEPQQAGVDHAVRLLVQGPDGEELGTFNLDFGVNSGEGVAPTEDVAVPLAIPMGQVQLPSAGRYSIEVIIDDRIARSIALEAVQRTDGAARPPEGAG